MIEDSIYL